MQLSLLAHQTDRHTRAIEGERGKREKEKERVRVALRNSALVTRRED